MASQTLTQRTSLPDGLRRLFGIKEWIAVALIAFSLLFNVLFIRPLEFQLAELENRARGLSRNAHTNDSSSTETQEQKLQQFYKFFERDKPYVVWLAMVYDLAYGAGIQLKQGEYQVESDEDPLLVSRQVTFPLVGTYPQLRMFIDGVLTTVPIAAVDTISFRRRHPDDPRLEAQVRFTLFLRKP